MFLSFASPLLVHNQHSAYPIAFFIVIIMPRVNPNIIAGGRVSAKMQHLRKTIFASAVLTIDTNVSGTSFEVMSSWECTWIVAFIIAI